MKLKGFNHWGWKITIPIVFFGITFIISVLMANSLATQLPQNYPNNAPDLNCPPTCGMSPWIWNHPWAFLGLLGGIFLSSVICIIVALLLPRPKKEG